MIVIHRFKKMLHILWHFARKLLFFNLRVRIGGKSFIIPVRKGAGLWNLRLNNHWFIDLLRFVRLPEDSVFIDVGVNLGQSLLKFRSCYDNPYYGFEPNANCVNYVRKLIRINQFKNIFIFPVGLYDRDEIAVLYSDRDINNFVSDGTIVSDLRPERYHEQDCSFVPVFKFDDIHRIKTAGQISMIKIDAEGAELEVISGMTETIRKYQPIITCEVLDYDLEQTSKKLQDRANKLFELLQSLHYRVYLIHHSEGKLRFEKKSEIRLVRWTPASLELNDYLFVPEGNSYLELEN